MLNCQPRAGQHRLRHISQFRQQHNHTPLRQHDDVVRLRRPEHLAAHHFVVGLDIAALNEDHHRILDEISLDLRCDTRFFSRSFDQANAGAHCRCHGCDHTDTCASSHGLILYLKQTDGQEEGNMV